MNFLQTMSAMIKKDFDTIARSYGSRNRVFYPPFFFDSIQDVETIAKKAVEKDIKIVAITDHDSLAGSIKLEKINKKENLGLIVIPACEISSKHGHVLAYGINEKIDCGLSAERTIDLIHKQGGIAVAAHPFIPFALNEKIHELAFDAIEILNAQIPVSRNLMAEEAAKKLNLPGIVGSDSHQHQEIGRSMMLLIAS